METHNYDFFLAVCSGIGALATVMVGCYWVIKKETTPIQLEIEMLKTENSNRDIKEEKHFKLIMGKLDEIVNHIAKIDKDYVSTDDLAKEQSKCPARKMAYDKLSQN